MKIKLLVSEKTVALQITAIVESTALTMQTSNFATEDVRNAMNNKDVVLQIPACKK